MNFKNILIISLLPFTAFSLEIRLKNKTITSRKFDQINQARTMTLEMQKALFKKNGNDFSTYKKELTNKLKSSEMSVLKDFLYAKAIQDKARKLKLKVFNQKAIDLFAQTQNLELQILKKYMDDGNSFQYSKELLIKDLKKKTYPIDPNTSEVDQYHQITNQLRQERIEQLRDQETKKAEYLLFHPKAAANYFLSPSRVHEERKRILAIYSKEENSEYAFFDKDLTPEIINTFYYFSPVKKSLFYVKKSTHQTTIIEDRLSLVIKLYISLLQRPVKTKKARIEKLKNSTDEKEVLLREIYSLLLNHRHTAQNFFRYLKKIKKVFITNDLPLSDIISAKGPLNEYTPVINALINYLSTNLPEVMFLNVTRNDIYSTDVYLKVEKKLNNLDFEENKKKFLNYDLFRFLNYVHVRGSNQRSILPTTLFK